MRGAEKLGRGVFCNARKRYKSAKGAAGADDVLVMFVLRFIAEEEVVTPNRKLGGGRVQGVWPGLVARDLAMARDSLARQRWHHIDTVIVQWRGHGK